ncbi:hypothetical protein A9Q81_17890 [Gammaproteobacteria bacterium 42_54_T18]|nr:hypothetical protein A9Q81_17890 [Gammaproteobacteria bacterium 42_54_T18]
MEKVLLYFAISLCIAATLLYLRRAFERSPVWGWMSILFPPVALIYYAVYWERSKKLACFHIVAFSVMLLSTVMAVRAHPFAFSPPLLSNLRIIFAPASYGEPLVLDEQRFPSKNDLKKFESWSGGKFGGKLAGQQMIVETVTLIDGVIRFTQGSGFFAERQVSIVLGEKSDAPRQHLLITPDAKDAPEIYLLTKNIGDELPDVDIITSGYWMDLTLERGALNAVSGHLRLLLPGSDQGFLTGYFDGFTDELRYDDGEIDRAVHSNATLEHVVSTHLKARLGDQLLAVNGFDNTKFDLNGMYPEGRSTVSFTLFGGMNRSETVMLFYSNDGWAVMEQSTSELVAAVKQMRQNPPAAGSLKEEVPLEVSVEESEQLLGKSVVVLLRGGKEREGTLQEITPFVIVIRNVIGAGHVDISIGKREVESVRLTLSKASG